LVELSFKTKDWIVPKMILQFFPSVRRFYVPFLFLLLVMVQTGCQGYVDGSSRTFGQITDDAGIAAAVKSGLIRDDDVAAWPVNVEVDRGVVSLYGRVSTQLARSKAISLAQGVKGVVTVEDRLTLVPKQVD